LSDVVPTKFMNLVFFENRSSILYYLVIKLLSGDRFESMQRLA